MKHKKQSIGIIVMFFLIILCLCIVNIILPNKVFSSSENRSLEQFPAISMSRIFNEEFQTDFETYKNDQFVSRDLLKKLKTTIDYHLGIHQIDDVYIGKDGMLFQMFEEIDDTSFNNKVNRINQFQTNHPDIKSYFLLVPNKLAIYEDKLPLGLPKSNQEKTINQFLSHLDNQIQTLDICSLFKKEKEEYLYYDTDHHWTTRAANLVFTSWLEKNELSKIESYKTYISNENFIGTLANRSGYDKTKDTIEIYLPQDSKVDYLVKYVEENTQSTSVYDSSKQLSNDPYAVFLSGNHPRVDISTTVETQQRLLIFKDSYANCMIPFLLPYYSEIVVIDPRYYYDDIQTLIEDKNINEVMFLYNANTFFSDHSLEELIK